MNKVAEALTKAHTSNKTIRKNPDGSYTTETA
jgi:hypothetical protein